MIGSFSWRLMTFAAALALAAGDAARADLDPPRRSSLSALRDLVSQLTDEARDAKRDGFLRHEVPNAASRCARTIGSHEVSQALVEPQHRDGFIDAYIRWQLTSFDAPLPEMSDRQFARFLDQLPAMAENPRGSEEVIDLFNRAADAGTLSNNDLAQLREVNRELDRRTQAAELMNRPATELRAWVRERSGAAGMRPLLLLLESCAAHIRAAWMPSHIKRQISESMSESARDQTIAARERAAIGQFAQRLAGLRRRLVHEVTFMADGSVRVTFSTAAVTQRDVENWNERLAGEQ